MDSVEDFLKRLLKGENPALDKMAGNAKRRIGQSVDSNVRQINQQGAQSGFRGIGANKINDAYRTGSDATVQMEDSLMDKEMQSQQFAAQGLMQLDAQKTDFWDVLSGVLGSGVGALTGGLGGGLGMSLASNLFKK